MKILDSIGKRNGTDKSSKFHDYLNKYEKYLPFPRDKKLNILEIGVLRGESLKTWEEYFYNSNVIGIDINQDCKIYESGKIKIEIGDQTDENFLNWVCSKHGPFDLIIDDGSHMNEHMLLSFKYLFKNLKNQGVYVIEDVVCSYWPEFGGGLKSEKSVVENFKNRIDEVNFFGEKVNSNNYCMRNDSVLLEQFKQKPEKYVGTEIESLNFLNSIIIITKR